MPKRKARKVEFPLRFNEFSPRISRGEITLTSDEVEALRLVGIEKRSQKDAARILGVSQPTFNRIFRKAIEKISKALVFSYKIKIELKPEPLTKIYKCRSCKFVWISPIGYQPTECPSCGSGNILVENFIKNE